MHLVQSALSVLQPAKNWVTIHRLGTAALQQWSGLQKLIHFSYLILSTQFEFRFRGVGLVQVAFSSWFCHRLGKQDLNLQKMYGQKICRGRWTEMVKQAEQLYKEAPLPDLLNVTCDSGYFLSDLSPQLCGHTQTQTHTPSLRIL